MKFPFDQILLKLFVIRIGFHIKTKNDIRLMQKTILLFQHSYNHLIIPIFHE